MAYIRLMYIKNYNRRSQRKHGLLPSFREFLYHLVNVFSVFRKAVIRDGYPVSPEHLNSKAVTVVGIRPSLTVLKVFAKKVYIIYRRYVTPPFETPGNPPKRLD